MKYIVVLGDGMADEPIPELGGKTPLEAADTPVMDMLARKGRVGQLITVPEGFHPGSEIANLSVLGYNVPEVFEGRGVLEAANMGVDIKPGHIIMDGRSREVRLRKLWALRPSRIRLQKIGQPLKWTSL